MTSHVIATTDELPTRRAYVTFGLLFLLYMFDYMDRLVIVSLFPFLQRDWGLTDTQCGLLVSAVYWSILVCAFPVAVLVDRWSRKKTIGLMATLWSLATLACVFTRSFGQLFAARTAIGVGEAGYAPGGTALISALFPRQRRARILGLWNAAIPLGSALGIVIGGVVAERWGWRHAFGIVALPGLFLALLFFGVRDYRTVALVAGPKGTSADGPVRRLSAGDVARAFVRRKSLLFNNLAFAANVFVTTALMSWLPTYFHRTDGLPMDQAGTRSGLIMFLAIVGAPLGGYLTDRWMQRNPRARMLLPALSSSLSALLLFAAMTWFDGPLQYALLLGVGVTIIMFVPAGVAVTQDVVHPGVRATSLSINIVVQHLLGSTLGPVFVGFVSDSRGLQSALRWLPLFTLAAGLLFWVGSRFYPRDVAAVGRVDVEVEA